MLNAETVKRIIDDLETKAEGAETPDVAAGYQYAAQELEKALQDG